MIQMTPRIRGIVFSYNRAMQLDATLRSFYLHCRDAHLVHLSVLYKADNPLHTRHYQILARDYPQVTFYPEKNFRRDTLKILTTGFFTPFIRLWFECFSYLINTQNIHSSILKHAITRQAQKMQQRIASKKFPSANGLYNFFLVDDNHFIGDFSMSEVIQALESNPDALGFSLRLGKNTSHSYTRDAYQKLPSFLQLGGKVLSYAWADAELSFGYPLEVSSSIYCAQLIAPLVSTLQFHQPNKLEGQMAACSSLFRKTHPRLLCLEISVTFCNPVNMVQHIFPNRAGETVNFSVQDLAERFERGERIDMKTLNGFVPNGCHQEVKLNFICNPLLENSSSQEKGKPVLHQGR